MFIVTILHAIEKTTLMKWRYPAFSFGKSFPDSEQFSRLSEGWFPLDYIPSFLQISSWSPVDPFSFCSFIRAVKSLIFFCTWPSATYLPTYRSGSLAAWYGRSFENHPSRWWAGPFTSSPFQPSVSTVSLV